jgi:beta-lactamase class A
VKLRRGVQDEQAFEAGLNNETTAEGLVQLFAALRGDFLSKRSRERVVHILLEQKFTSMIPAGLPSHATVAHKTGEISSACHDAGIVYLPEREPYIVAILTEVDPDKNNHRETVKRISEAVYEAVTGKRASK